MTTRRSFIKAISLASAAFLASPRLFAFDHKYIGLQLYTVRDAMATDPAGTIAKVAQIGYNSLEGATYTGSQKFYGMDPQAFAAVLKQNNVMMPSAHYRVGIEKTKGE